MRIAPLPARRIIAVAAAQVRERRLERLRHDFFAAFHALRAYIVAPARLPGAVCEDVGDELRPRAPIAGESVAQLIGVDLARELAPPSDENERLGAIRRHA